LPPKEEEKEKSRRSRSEGPQKRAFDTYREKGRGKGKRGGGRSPVFSKKIAARKQPKFYSA